MNRNLASQDKVMIDQLTDMFTSNPRVMEVFKQIYTSSKMSEEEGISAYDIKVRSRSGRELAYSSVHRWIKILLKNGAVRMTRHARSKKRGIKKLYASASKGEKAYFLAVDYIKIKNRAAKELRRLAEKQSTKFSGLGAPDLLEAALELIKKEHRNS